eukprot:COSAG02_NODE_10300_length_1975_cov_1.264925_2_plen_240_part_00
MTAFAQAATLLNKCGVWPIYSMGNAMNPTVSPERGYPQTMESELTPLLASGASWARFYEFWGWSGADYGIRSALNLTALGVPLVMHAYPGRGGPDDITMAVAMFLIVQTEFCYFGTSVGGKGFTPWDDPACAFLTTLCFITIHCRRRSCQSWCSACDRFRWTWHELYDAQPGRPLGNASYDFTTTTWTRSFTNAVVTVNEKRNYANITLRNGAGTTEFVREITEEDIEWQKLEMVHLGA